MFRKGEPHINTSDIDISMFNGVYSEIANLLGEEAAIQIHKAYRGQQLTFPVHLYSKEYLVDKIVKEYDGKNIKQLATKYGYSEKWVRNIIKEKME